MKRLLFLLVPSLVMIPRLLAGIEIPAGGESLTASGPLSGYADPEIGRAHV